MTDWNNIEEVFKKLTWDDSFGLINAEILENVSKELWKDRKFVLSIVKMHGEALKYASKELRADREVVQAVIKTRPWDYQHADDSLKNDPEFIKKVKQNMKNYVKRYEFDPAEFILFEATES